MKKIAVVIPIFNSESYLDECLSSVRKQTLKDIEIICVDDGSSDNSSSIITRHSEDDIRIKHLKIQHSGPGIARNIGIDEASSEFVAFMDSDDFYLYDNTLEELYYTIKKDGTKICGGSWSEYDGSKIISEFKDDGGYVFKNHQIIDYVDYQFDFGFHRFIYDLEMLNRNNIRFPAFLRYQDPPFFVQSMLCSKRFSSIADITYCRRQKKENPINTEKKMVDFISGVKEVLILSQENDLNVLKDTTIKRINQHSILILDMAIVNDSVIVRDEFIEFHSHNHFSPFMDISPFFLFLLLKTKTCKKTHWTTNVMREMVMQIFAALKSKGFLWLSKLLFRAFL